MMQELGWEDLQNKATADKIVNNLLHIPAD